MTAPPLERFVAADEPVHRFSCPAMGTTFELLLAGADRSYAQQAAQAALAELELLEDQLSRFRSSSDVARINRLEPGQAVRVGPATLECLQLAVQAWARTQGAFDPAILALAEAWKALGPDAEPPADELARARSAAGLERLIVDPHTRAVGLKPDARGPAGVDLGGIGKGFALDEMARVLGDWGVEAAMLSGGQSTVLAIGPPDRNPVWALPLRDPDDQTTPTGLARLRNRALSGSGRSLHGDHVLDPRTGRPARDRLAAWTTAPSAAWADALSTAAMAMTDDELAGLAGAGDVSALLLDASLPRRVIRIGADFDYLGRLWQW